MPPKNGPATAKNTSAQASDAPNPEPSASEAPEAKEATAAPAEDGTVKPEEAPPQVVLPGVRDQDAARKMYPEGAELWFGSIDGLVFAFPRIQTITPSRQWLRQVYQLTEIAQTFEWMVLAKIPSEIQDQTDLLTDAQYQALFRAWYVDGEVELPK